MSFFAITFLVLLVLKLTGTDISWFWVWAPLILEGIIDLSALVVMFFGGRAFNKKTKGLLQEMDQAFKDHGPRW